MKLYYTVASQPEDKQVKSQLSLGGYKSASLLPSGAFGAMFSEISMYTVKNGNSNRYMGLVLVNNQPTAVKNIELWFTYPVNCYSTLRVAAVDMVVDAEGGLMMEHVPSDMSKPVYAEFVEAGCEVDRVNVGDLPLGGQLGIWIERELNLPLIKEDQNKIYEKSVSDPYRYNEVELAKEDLIELGISWDIVEVTQNI